MVSGIKRFFNKPTYFIFISISISVFSNSIASAGAEVSRKKEILRPDEAYARAGFARLSSSARTSLEERPGASVSKEDRDFYRFSLGAMKSSGVRAYFNGFELLVFDSSWRPLLTLVVWNKNPLIVSANRTWLSFQEGESLREKAYKVSKSASGSDGVGGIWGSLIPAAYADKRDSLVPPVAVFLGNVTYGDGGPYSAGHWLEKAKSGDAGYSSFHLQNVIDFLKAVKTKVTCSRSQKIVFAGGKNSVAKDVAIQRTGEWIYTVDSGGKKYRFAFPQDVLDSRSPKQKQQSPAIDFRAPLSLYSNEQEFCEKGKNPCKLAPQDYPEIPWLDLSAKSTALFPGVEGLRYETLVKRLIAHDEKMKKLLPGVDLASGGQFSNACRVDSNLKRLSGSGQVECEESNWHYEGSPAHDVWYDVNSSVVSPIYRMAVAYEMINSCCADNKCKRSMYEVTDLDLPEEEGNSLRAD